MGSIAISSPFTGLTDPLFAVNQSLPGLGNPLTALRYTGAHFSLAMTATGAPTVPAFPTVPADAVAIEVWASSTAASDGIAFAPRSGQLANDGGGLVPNTSINTGASSNNPNRHVVAGAHMVIPLPSTGAAIPAGWRFAILNTSTLTMQGRYVSAAANLPYRIGGTEEFRSIGAGAVFDMNNHTSVPARFPVGYVGCVLQVIGAGVRCTLDGTAPAVAVGDIIAPGAYLIDEARHGISLAALRWFLPSGTFLIGHALIAG